MALFLILTAIVCSAEGGLDPRSSILKPTRSCMVWLSKVLVETAWVVVSKFICFCGNCCEAVILPFH